jgi:hypothetical protein
MPRGKIAHLAATFHHIDARARHFTAGQSDNGLSAFSTLAPIKQATSADTGSAHRHHRGLARASRGRGGEGGAVGVGVAPEQAGAPPAIGGLARCGHQRRRPSIGRTGGLATHMAGHSRAGRKVSGRSGRIAAAGITAGSRRARSAHAKARRRSPRRVSGIRGGPSSP